VICSWNSFCIITIIIIIIKYKYTNNISKCVTLKDHVLHIKKQRYYSSSGFLGLDILRHLLHNVGSETGVGVLQSFKKFEIQIKYNILMFMFK